MTVFATMKLEVTREAEKLSDPAAASRVAEAISLSAGELALVTTFGIRARVNIRRKNVIEFDLYIDD